MRRALVLLLAGGLLAAGLAPVVGSSADAASPNLCGLLRASAGTTGAAPASVGPWHGPALDRARQVIAAGESAHAPVRAQAIAVMAAMGSTSLGRRSTPAPGAAGRPSLDPLTRSSAFYAALLQVPGWRALPPSVVAHRVLGNADPLVFAPDWGDAVAVVQALTGSSILTAYASTFGGTHDSCRAFRTDGEAPAYPLPAGSGFHDLASYGRPGPGWRHGDPGTSVRAACGTPVLAATAGTVRVRTTPAWSGRWLVQVVTGPGSVATSYAHLRRVGVANGTQVRAGQRLGEVGDLGATHACGLGFVVHPAGASGPTVDPTLWLSRTIGATAIAPLHPPVQPFTLATFNVLGDSHTHEHKGFRRGAARMPRAFALLQQHGVQVAGLQEVQPVQLGVLVGLMGSSWDRYPLNAPDTENTLIWRTDSFEKVEEHTITVPYFGGHPRNIPVVQLRQRSSGATAWFMNTHNPADIDASPHNARWRAIAVQRERAEAQRLLALNQGPVFFTGDMNDREKVVNGLAGVLHSAGGSFLRQVDYIFGSDAVRFTGFDVDGSSLAGISDHRLVVAVADFSGATG